MLFAALFEQVRRSFQKNLTVTTLKSLIIMWALFIIVLTLFIDNEWVLAGMLAYEVLP
jgi:hypothetical protein